MMKKQRLIGTILIAVCVVAVCLDRQTTRWTRLNACVNEIGAAFETIFSIGCVRGDLYYGYGSVTGNELHRMDPKKPHGESVPLSFPVSRLLVSSPDQRYLLLKAMATRAPASAPTQALTEWMMMLDCSSGIALPIKEMTGFGKYPVWLDADTFIFVGRPVEHSDTGETGYFVDLPAHDAPDDLRELSALAARVITNSQQNLVRMVDRRLALELDGEINVLNFAANTIERISHFGGQFSGLAWLTFSPQTNRFLFCSTKTGEIFRNLFMFDPVAHETTRLTTEHTYNGQWLEAGAGYAFIGNHENSFYLGVRPSNQAMRTNLFTSGFVERFTVSPDGTRIYTVASTNAEPRALWEYDILGGKLRQLLPGNKLPFQNSFVSAPAEAKMTSFDGLQVPTYLFPPENPVAGRKYPIIVYLPPRTAQCSRGYELQAQLMANLGFYYLGLNYRGCDGYGSEYSSKWSVAGAARDAQAIIKSLANDPRFDRERIFVTAMSDSSLILGQLLSLDPKLVKAAAFVSPAPFDLPASPTADFPPVLVSMGRNDPVFPFGQRFREWAQEHSVSANFYFIDHYGHPGTTEIIRARVEQEKATAKFLLKQL